MKGFVLTLEAVISLLVLFVVVALLFLPALNSFSVLEYVRANDEFTAKMLQSFPYPCCASSEGENCIEVRHYFGEDKKLHSVCVR